MVLTRNAQNIVIQSRTIYYIERGRRASVRICSSTERPNFVYKMEVLVVVRRRGKDFYLYKNLHREYYLYHPQLTFS